MGRKRQGNDLLQLQQVYRPWQQQEQQHQQKDGMVSI
jgi:hypothetical protein